MFKPPLQVSRLQASGNINMMPRRVPNIRLRRLDDSSFDCNFVGKAVLPAGRERPFELTQWQKRLAPGLDCNTIKQKSLFFGIPRLQTLQVGIILDWGGNLGIRILLGSSYYDDWQNGDTFVKEDP